MNSSSGIFTADIVVACLITFILFIFGSQTSWVNAQRLSSLSEESGSVCIVDPFGYKGEIMGPVVTVPQSELVVGDRFLLPVGLTVPCDAVLISGRVVMDESMLTGESVPVTKTPIEVTGLGGVPEAVPLVSARIPQDPSEANGYLSEINIAEKRPASVLFGGTKVCVSHACITSCVICTHVSRNHFRLL